MKVFPDNSCLQPAETGCLPHQEPIHPAHPGHPVPPHLRKALISFDFDEKDWTLLKEVFGDEDTAAAAAQIIKESPLEIQILAIQIMNILEEAA